MIAIRLLSLEALFTHMDPLSTAATLDKDICSLGTASLLACAKLIDPNLLNNLIPQASHLNP